MVSIIIPVYNSEKYLSKCLDSVVNQTYKDLEIIIINDGSTDSSTRILKHYKESDLRITVLNQNNNGLSSARNAGLKTCSGDYVLFFDSDDFMEKNMVETMYKRAVEVKADVVVCPYLYMFTDGHINKRKIKQGTIGINESSRIRLIKNYLVESAGYDFVVWNKLYKAEIINQKGILFESNHKVFSEDTIFNFDIFLNCHIVATVDEYLCFYRQHDKSIMNSYKKDLHLKFISLHKSLLNRISNNKLLTDLETEFGCFSFNLFMMVVNNEKVSKDKTTESINRIRLMMNDISMKNSILKLDLSMLSKKRKIAYIFYKMKLPSVIYIISRIFGK